MGAMVAMTMFQQTDTTFEVGSAERLNVETMGGSIVVGVWDEERIRVQAEHSTRTFIEIDRGRSEIQVESEARRGPANIVDFRITVPRRLALELEAQYGDIVIEGADGAVEAETLQGDVTIIGGRGTVEVSATMGSIRVEGADGRIEIESSAADIHVVNSSGEIYAESAGGSIILEDVSPSVVDVGSTGGRVHYDGTFEPGGTYFFGAHGGSITIVVPEGASASFNVATVHGSITSNLRGEAEGLRGGERHEFQIGGGGALVEAETYGGRIRLLRSGTEGTEAPTPRRNRNRDGEARDRYEMDERWVADMGEYIAAAVAPAVSASVAPAVAANVAPAIAVEVAPRVATKIAWRVASEVNVRVAPRVEIERNVRVSVPVPPAPPADGVREPATIRR